MSANLYEIKESKEFYENNYNEGYMDKWPKTKQKRVLELVRSLPLPKHGIILDYGCGNGIFTDVLKQALPNFEVYGCDISENAIKNATKRFPDCHFFVLEQENPKNIKADFIFSHHVLEHVYNMKQSLAEMNGYMKDNAFALHILPCRNRESFTHKICTLRTDGINQEMENRYYFEYVGHVRRLSPEELNKLMAAHNFVAEQQLYGNHFWGLMKWVSQYSPRYILLFTDTKKCINFKAKVNMLLLRVLLFFLMFLQLPVLVRNYIEMFTKNKSIQKLTLILNFIPFLLSYPFYWLINYLDRYEWKVKRNQKSGSEMYIFYKRTKK